MRERGEVNDDHHSDHTTDYCVSGEGMRVGGSWKKDWRKDS
jgi:hypothetical protein